MVVEVEDTANHPLEILAERYPQLLLPISSETASSDLYRDTVLRGKPVHGFLDFSLSEYDWLKTYITPAGSVEVLFLNERADFEHALRALAYRCSACDIPAFIGANTIIGLNNWKKINTHKQKYLLSGGSDWKTEFRLFTADKNNYQDTIIILSSGEYSAISSVKAGITKDEWLSKSLIIRCYHELTHFVCRKLWPSDIDLIRDEVHADLVGTYAAFGVCRPNLVNKFLGIENGLYVGGRLQHYVQDSELENAIIKVNRLLETYTTKIAEINSHDVYELMTIRLSDNP